MCVCVCVCVRGSHSFVLGVEEEGESGRNIKIEDFSLEFNAKPKCNLKENPFDFAGNQSLRAIFK